MAASVVRKKVYEKEQGILGGTEKGDQFSLCSKGNTFDRDPVSASEVDKEMA